MYMWYGVKRSSIPLVFFRSNACIPEYSAATMPDEEYSKIVGELKTLIEKNGLVGDFARGIEKGFG